MDPLSRIVKSIIPPQIPQEAALRLTFDFEEGKAPEENDLKEVIGYLYKALEISKGKDTAQNFLNMCSRAIAGEALATLARKKEIADVQNIVHDFNEVLRQFISIQTQITTRLYYRGFPAGCLAIREHDKSYRELMEIFGEKPLYENDKEYAKKLVERLAKRELDLKLFQKLEEFNNWKEKYTRE